MANPTTIANFDLYPSSFVPTPQWIGGTLKRSLSGYGRRKFVSDKMKLVLAFEAIDGDTRATLKVIWSLAKQGAVTIVNTDYGINSTFICTDPSFNFTPQEGDGYLYSGTMTFEEQ